MDTPASPHHNDQEALLLALDVPIEQDRHTQRPMDQQVRMGFFSWSHPMPPSPVTPQEGANHEPQ